MSRAFLTLFCIILWALAVYFLSGEEKGLKVFVDSKRSFFLHLGNGLFLGVLGVMTQFPLLTVLGGFVALAAFVANFLDVPFKLKDFNRKKAEIEEFANLLLESFCKERNEGVYKYLQEVEKEKNRFVSNYKWSFSLWIVTFVMVILELSLNVVVGVDLSNNKALNGLTIFTALWAGLSTLFVGLGIRRVEELKLKFKKNEKIENSTDNNSGGKAL